jgi:sulfatase modifying factor 1
MKSLTGPHLAIQALTLIAVISGSVYAEAPSKHKDMVLIPKGEFTMGGHHHADEAPHQVVLDTYYMDKYEVSNARYGDFMKATNHPAPAYWDNNRLNKPEQPVVGVNWYDAGAFCKWEGKRLPTEAEWEKAAKGPEGNLHYPWGHQFDAKRANYGQNLGYTSPVDSFPEGASGYGVYNMAGNVFEWVGDWYDPNYFKSSPALNPQGPEKGYKWGSLGEMKVLRGGSWLAPETSLHTTHRFWNRPENNSYGVGLGFRCVKDVPESVILKAREAYIHTLISMGAEKFQDALKSVEQALMVEPANREYLDLRTQIKKHLAASGK